MIEPPLLNKHKADQLAGKNTFTASVVTQSDRKFSLRMGSFLNAILLLTQISKNGCQPNICWQRWNPWLKPLENVKGYLGNPNVRLCSNTKRDAEASNIHTWDHCINIISFPQRIGFFCQEKEEKGQGTDQTWKELLNTLQQFFFGLYLGSQRKSLWFCQTFK